MPNIYTPEKTIQLARLWHQQFHRIVFVNGCFDVLHWGHLHLLETGKMLGTRLIIAVNDNDYCRRKKGPTRPIQPAEIRVRSAAGAVEAHAATIFSDDTPEALLCQIRPHIYLMGDDYQGREIPGADHCERVEFRTRLAGFSTSEICLRLG